MAFCFHYFCFLYEIGCSSNTWNYIHLCIICHIAELQLKCLIEKNEANTVIKYATFSSEILSSQCHISNYYSLKFDLDGMYFHLELHFFFFHCKCKFFFFFRFSFRSGKLMHIQAFCKINVLCPIGLFLGEVPRFFFWCLWITGKSDNYLVPPHLC